MGTYLILIIPVLLLSMFVQWRFRNKFAKYAEMQLNSALSGKEVAEKMLQDNGIYDVRVLSVEGQLTDHYNPADKTVNLSPDVYYGRSAASAAVAAHECGHAVQHATAYSMLQFRSSMVPVLSIANNFTPMLLMIGVMIMYSTGSKLLLTIGVALFAVATIFSFITLPVEFDASNRAIKWMQQRNIVTPREHEMAKDALKWAALTYVVAAIGMLAQLLYYLNI